MSGYERDYGRRRRHRVRRQGSFTRLADRLRRIGKADAPPSGDEVQSTGAQETGPSEVSTSSEKLQPRTRTQPATPR